MDAPSHAPMPDRTQVSNAAIALADMYEVHCANLAVQGDVSRRPVLTIPVGPSTQGGKLARQHITLEPDGAQAGSITVGWVDLPKRRASLKTFACLLDAHRARFGSRPFPLDGVGYERFLGLTLGFLKDQGFTIEMERKPTLPTEVAPPDRTGTWVVPLLVLGIFVVGLLLALVFLR